MRQKGGIKKIFCGKSYLYYEMKIISEKVPECIIEAAAGFDHLAFFNLCKVTVQVFPQQFKLRSVNIKLYRCYKSNYTSDTMEEFLIQ